MILNDLVDRPCDREFEFCFSGRRKSAFLERRYTIDGGWGIPDAFFADVNGVDAVGREREEVHVHRL